MHRATTTIIVFLLASQHFVYTESGTSLRSLPNCCSTLQETLCYGSNPASFIRTIRVLYVASGLVSLACFAVVFTVYLTLPELKNRQGRIVMGNVVASALCGIGMLGGVCLGPKAALEKEDEEDEEASRRPFERSLSHVSSHIAELETLFIPDPACRFLGFWIYYFIVSTMTWLAVLCFDIRKSIANQSKSLVRRSSRQLDASLVSYTVFSTLFPLVLTAVVAALDAFEEEIAHAVGDGNWPEVLRPRIGQESCFLTIRSAKGLVFVPTFFLLCFNLAIFVRTVNALRMNNRMMRKAGVRRESMAEKENHKSELVLFAKLFVLMGLPFLFDSVHMFTHGDHSQLTSCSYYAEIFYRVMGGINILRGVFVFAVFICKPDIWKSVCREVNSRRGYYRTQGDGVEHEGMLTSRRREEETLLARCQAETSV